MSLRHRCTVHVWSGFGSIGWGSLFALLMLAGCAGKPALSPEDQVRARADDYWAGLIAADYDKAYGFLAPGFRVRVPAEAYGKRFAEKITFHEAVINKIVCETEVCNLEVDTKQTIHAIPPFNFDLEQAGSWKQKWIHTDDGWWLLPKK